MKISLVGHHRCVAKECSARRKWPRHPQVYRRYPEKAVGADRHLLLERQTADREDEFVVSCKSPSMRDLACLTRSGKLTNVVEFVHHARAVSNCLYRQPPDWRTEPDSRATCHGRKLPTFQPFWAVRGSVPWPNAACLRCQAVCLPVP